MTRVAIYARYSSDRQNERSVADQVALCSQHAEAKGWELTRFFSDAAISGSSMANRPGLLDAIAAAERGEYDILLTEDEDRIARDLEYLAHVTNRIRDAGARLWTIASGQVETMHVAMKGLIAEDFIRNLSAKTKRGMRSNAEKGLATGSRLYGYRSEPGGALAIVESEAQVIRRIFTDYAAGATSREIAVALNAEGVPGPRGGLWNQSSIGGSVQRGNGILNTELYVGVKVWGRMDVRKDRATGKRRPRMLPAEDWKRTPVPHLRIVSDNLWQLTRARKASNAAPRNQGPRKRGVFSGLLKCGVCGGTYTVYTTGKLICATYREKGTCTNRRTPKRADVEAVALEALREKILTPEAVRLYVRAYHRAAAARTKGLTALRLPLEKRLAEIRRGIDRIVGAIERGVANEAMEARMAELDRERRSVEAQLNEAGKEPNVVAAHPGAADEYIALIEGLRETLAGLDLEKSQAQRELMEAVRGLVDHIEIVPLTQARGGPIDVVVHGTLARLMEPHEQPRNAGLGALVAGGGIEPPTCGL